MATKHLIRIKVWKEKFVLIYTLGKKMALTVCPLSLFHLFLLLPFFVLEALSFMPTKFLCHSIFSMSLWLRIKSRRSK